MSWSKHDRRINCETQLEITITLKPGHSTTLSHKGEAGKLPRHVITLAFATPKVAKARDKNQSKGKKRT
jgi:hypothetical protein